MRNDLQAMGSNSIKNFFANHSQLLAFLFLVAMMIYIIFFKQ